MMTNTKHKPTLTGNADIGYTVSDDLSHGYSKNIEWAYETYNAAKKETEASNSEMVRAAAPELLEALELMLKNYSGEWPSIDEIARAAIAKARGK